MGLFGYLPADHFNHEFNQLLWIRLADILEQDARWVKLRLPEFTAGLAYARA